MSKPDSTPWFFHDSNAQIDDPNAALPISHASFSASSLLAFPDGQRIVEDESSGDAYSEDAEPTKGPLKFTTTLAYVGTVSPVTDWYAFNPSDNRHIEEEFIRNNQSGKPVAVGLNRLFEVVLKHNCLRPIYSSSIGMVSNVHRSEWFFSSTMTPIHPDLESQLNKAFDEIRPWSTTYVSELASALEIPEAIDKLRASIVYKEDDKEVKYHAIFAPCRSKEAEEEDAQEDLHWIDEELERRGRALESDYVSRSWSGSGGASPSPSATKDGLKTPTKTSRSSTPKSPRNEKAGPQSPYREHPVVYLFSMPSSFPYITGPPSYTNILTALLNGKTPSGIVFTIQRHFDWSEYKKVKKITKSRPTDDPDFEPVPVKQLVLVLHGIGQKLSERVQNLNFTYAINRFRILVNEQLDRPGVEEYCNGHAPGSIVVLPVNWRKGVTFDELSRFGDDISGENVKFTLSDVTMRSIPAVRNLITDVMLDIPYYMSRYKPLLVRAAVREANRIYNLFMTNNPNFNGKVNVVGHSLGSLIAMDILSQQPTDISKSRKQPSLNPSELQKVPKDVMFDFNTEKLFCVGSPAGFFLLMERRHLCPRKTFVAKTDAESQYGCLAVKNIYNVLHHSDPIAYLLNPTVDSHFSRDCYETAILPAEDKFPATKETNTPRTSGILDSITFRFRGFGSSSKEEQIDADLLEAAAVGVNSDKDHKDDISEAVELEEHHSDEEEKAALKKMELLNENGQVDWMIPLTGTLENQYLSMITAHSGYWDNKDFARLVAIECTRKPGVENTLKQYRAKRKEEK